MSGITHRVAEERSLALHREVARRLRERPEILEAARARVKGWKHDGAVHPYWIEQWKEVLARSLNEVIEAITDTGEFARSLRQCSPFAGVIDSKTRWQILRRCEQERRAHDSGSA